MKTCVIYKSNYGTTKQYAKWIASALSVDLYERKVTSLKDLLNYDTIIYGGGLYAGGLIGIDIISKNADALKSKNIIVFTVGLADTSIEDNIKGINTLIEKHIKEYEKIKTFNFRGGIDYSTLSAKHKIMMKMLQKSIAKKKQEDLTAENIDFLKTYNNKAYFCDEATIQPLVEYVNELG